MIGITAIHPPCAKHGKGDREAVEGQCAILTAFGPSVTPSARHLPKAALQGGY